MKPKNILPYSISSRTEHKRKFRISEMYIACTFIPRAMFFLINNFRKKNISKQFSERLQLAVTEVNGCAACSYAHAHMALNAGMSSEEIKSFLCGNNDFVKPDEAKAIVFAQHYAETGAKPDKKTYSVLLEEYGKEKSKAIISSIQIITVGNIFGIPYSALLSRLRRRPYKNSSLVYEIGMPVIGFIILPAALTHGLLSAVLGYPEFHNSKDFSHK
ncbi:MAG: carboxymuconolactone decarboxylase family protein [Bacteroidales bacterium]|nr:carboxymuconolactone decarboxylase family protein [Bacteroidales bacterium]